tara:strand:+ start:683 stop:1507 length:825 start_codon:yes stop_codon:yes gene_type:complete
MERLRVLSIKNKKEIMSAKNLISDKKVEKKRYELRAQNILKKNQFNSPQLGSKSIKLFLRSPYLFYEKTIRDFIKPDHEVLEIGSGFGEHTYCLLKTNAKVTATDISKDSLKVLKNVFSKYVKKKRLIVKVADMESLPFENGTFDIVVCAGSLSYGKSETVDYQIRRVLKSNGRFICVDSLNNNVIYRLNRFMHFLNGSRSKMTILNMPDINRLESMMEKYNKVDINYFGSVTYLLPVISILIGEYYSNTFSNYIDKMIRVKNSAFKFVLNAKV